MQTLTYKDHPIAIRGEMLNLTDMWKAQGSPEHREPYNWARKEGSPFIEAVALSHNLPDGQVMKAKRGKGGATTAHWQIGLAYAKYLSPEFHMWCNTVVRERMENKAVAIIQEPVAIDMKAVGGMVKAILRKQGEEIFAPMLKDVVREVANDLVKAELASGTVAVTTDFVPASFLLAEMKLKPKERKGLASPISGQLRKYSAQVGNRFPRDRFCEIAKRYVFHIDMVRDWMMHGGGALYVAECLARKRSNLGSPDLFVITDNGKRKH